MSDDTVPGRPAAVTTGIVAAIVMACLSLLAILGSPLNAISCVVFLAVALGLRHGSAWSGYGGALYLAAQWVATPLAMARSGQVSTPWVSLLLGSALAAVFAYLLFRAARALSGNVQGRSRWAWIALAVVTVLAPQVFRGYSMPTGSMEDTLLIGDQILVGVLGAPTPSRGDLIVFRYPVDTRQTFIKRCMGVPGDRIKLVNKQLYINGKKLDEPYACHRTEYIDAYRDNFPSEPNVRISESGRDMLAHHVVSGEVVVPPDSYFAIGDNRDASLDSRYWGFVPRADLVGTPLFIYGSYEAPTRSHPIPGQRWGRILTPVRGYAVN
jgi:signal peptidase I